MEFTQFITEAVEALAQPKRIILIDGDDKRTQDAARELVKKTKNIVPVLLFENDQFPTDLPERVECVNVFADQTQLERFTQQFFELRKGKETLEKAQAFMQHRINIGMMMYKNQLVDGVVGGLSYPTSDILRGGFKVFGLKPNKKTFSSVMLMHRGNERLIFADVAVNLNPTKDQLVDITQNAIEFNQAIKYMPDSKVAMLSFSTKGSAETERTLEIAAAAQTVASLNVADASVKVAGEIQFDAGVDEVIRKSKYKELVYDGSANIFIFPNLDAGNISYKVAQRLGNWGAVGPVIVGINGAVNDLSRGSTVEDVVYTAMVTALQS
ncbi:phosphate acetyltransferase [Mycoplasmoides fastidiosum]|uniref:Phosphate acetyltransferase n=1 Tax=Mycoplasmoides fastidiosum TaxID=92758 RepID=A0ABU0LZC6_9BACT|nr:phosphotransacetylase [Mycoplasmoides fastidiosum]MDQ0514056.1 phosphate acetyltransferase [Mycoplasmoides fastidiosum]UUD37533.1 phosphotransacetylase [Mycoplasmoides fastidiosum]